MVPFRETTHQINFYRSVKDSVSFRSPKRPKTPKKPKTRTKQPRKPRMPKEA